MREYAALTIRLFPRNEDLVVIHARTCSSRVNRFEFCRSIGGSSSFGNKNVRIRTLTVHVTSFNFVAVDLVDLRILFDPRGC